MPPTTSLSTRLRAALLAALLAPLANTSIAADDRDAAPDSTPGVLAPAFDVPWHTVDDGGGRISGGGFAAVVTIGQPEPPGKLVGGEFTLRGGFWPRPVDSPTIFADGLESGTVNAWSSSTP